MFKTFSDAEKRVPGAMVAAINAAAEVYEDATRESISANDLIGTGALYASILRGKVYRDGDGVGIKIWPQGTRTDGKHRRGERNAVIGYIQDYGRSYGKRRRAGKHFMEDSAEKAEAPALDAMRKELDAIFKP